MADIIENIEFEEISQIPVTEDKSGIRVIGVDSNDDAKAYPLDNFKTGDEVDAALQAKADKTELTSIKNDITTLQNNKLDKSALDDFQVTIKRYKDPVNNISDLPTSGNEEGDGRTVINDKNDSNQSFIWVWDSTKWGRTPFTTLPSDLPTKAEVSLKADIEIISVPLTVKLTQAAIGESGARQNVANWTVYGVNNIKPGDKYRVRVSTVTTGSTLKRAYAFYSNDTVSSESFISGGDAIGGAISIDENITVPDGAVMMCITRDSQSANYSDVYKIETSLLGLIHETNSIVNSKTPETETDRLTEMPLTSVGTNSWIGEDGGQVQVAQTARVMSTIANAGEEYKIKSSLTSTGGIIKRAYGFYTQLPISVDNFISGSTPTASVIETDEIVTIPAGATILAISVRTDRDYHIYRKDVSIFEDIEKIKIVAEGKADITILQPLLTNYLGDSNAVREDGSISPIISGAQCKSCAVTPGEEYNLKLSFRSTGTNKKRGYGFYNSLTPSADSFISGGDALGSAISIDENITVPDGAVLLVISTYQETGYQLIRLNTPILAEIQKVSNGTSIIFVGDSLTAIGSGYSSYFSIPNYSQQRFGVGGENSLQILGRMGFIPFEISQDFTIPADKTPVSIGLRSPWNKSTSFPRQNFGMNTCVIRGVKGSITVTTAGSAATFTRDVEGSTTEVKTGETVITYNITENSDQIFIVWIGQNGGWTNADDLVDQFKDVARKIRSGKYIFATPHLNTSDELEDKMGKEFGCNYINMRRWCINYGLQESGITPTQDDIDAIAAGNCPPSLLSDGVHFVDAAKRAQAELFKRRLVELKMCK